MKRFMEEFSGLAWTVIGSGYVLMTVSGQPFRTGLILTIIGVLIQVSAYITPENSEDKDDQHG